MFCLPKTAWPPTWLEELVPHLSAHEAYLCGPGPWMDLVRRTLLEGGIPASHIHDERFNW